jgi:hypothetical protein
VLGHVANIVTSVSTARKEFQGEYHKPIERSGTWFGFCTFQSLRNDS